MSMRIIDNFEPHIDAPLDTRMYCDKKADLATIRTSDSSYPLMHVICKEDLKEYELSLDKTVWTTTSLKVESKSFSITVDSNGDAALSVTNVLHATAITANVDYYSFGDDYKVTKSTHQETFYPTPYMIGTTQYLHYSNSNTTLPAMTATVTVVYLV